MYMMYAIIFFALTLQSIETPKYKLLQKYEDFETNYELVGNLVHFGCIGDFCCGYGSPLIHFLKSGGQKIVGSDFDRKCITVFKERLENGEYQK